MKEITDFYYDKYLEEKNKKALDNNVREQLLLFENEIISRGYIHVADLQLAKYKSKINGAYLTVFHRDAGIKKFYIRLLRFHQHYLTQANFNEQPFLSIRVYFRLQSYEPLETGHQKINNLVVVPKVDEAKKFEEIKTTRQAFLDTVSQARLVNLRDPLRLHNKFTRSQKSLVKGRPSELLFKQIMKPDPGGIVLDGYAARSVIIALHKMIQAKKLNLGQTTNFKIGATQIAWKDKDDHGVVSLDVKNSVASYMHYVKDIHHLVTIEAKLKINLMAEMINRFSKKIEPFTKAEYKSLSDGEINFLNGFAFLSQICEVARYLSLNGRDIEQEPMSIALAITKHLRIGNNKTWEELYSKAPAVFAAQQTLKKYNTGSRTYVVDPTKQDLRGLDPASGASLKVNMSALRNKIAELDRLHPGRLSNIQSARKMRDRLTNFYGSGGESDSDDSPYSSDEESYKDIRTDRLKKNIAAWKPKKPIYKATNPWSAKGFRIQPVAYDGNCFFHAVVDQLQRIGQLNGHTPQSLRQMAIDHMLRYWDHYAGFSANGDDAYINQMIENGEWADHPIIQATAEMLDINIHIHRDQGEVKENLIPADSEHTITLGYFVDLHYVSLHEIEDASSISSEETSEEEAASSS